MAKIKFKKIIEKIAISPIFISFMVFLLAAFVVYRITVSKVESAYDKQFIRDVLVEAHGMLFDILIIGTFIFALHTLVERRREKKRNIQRWQEEIDDFREWKSEEAMFRITGNIYRLNKMGIKKINLSGCFLSKANLSRFDLSGAYLIDANLSEANLRGTNFSKAFLLGANLSKAELGSTLVGISIPIGNDMKKRLRYLKDFSIETTKSADLSDALLYSADLSHAELKEVNLKGAFLRAADLRKAKDLTLEQLSKVDTLCQAKLDPKLLKQIKEKYPHLLEIPKKEKKGKEE